MGYFPNGSSGERYHEQWCERCINWREHPEIPGNWGCPIIDLHMDWNYAQCNKNTIAVTMKKALSHFIPTKDDFPTECRMFLERQGADIPGQMKITFEG